MKFISAAMRVRNRTLAGYRAYTRPGDVPPHKVPHEDYGHHSSFVESNAQGRWRVWGFKSLDGRNRFLKDFPKATMTREP